MNKAILIINANLAAAQTIKHNLTSPNTEIVCVSSMHDALQTFINTEFCLIILDAGISAEDDHQLLKAMRKARTTPILILSSRSCREERLKVFQAGAHVYIGEPYSLEECLAQAQSLMEPYCELKPQREICYTLAFGKDLVIDPQTRQVLLNGSGLQFTRKEFDLLFCLASNPGQVFSREQLYEQVWDEHAAYNVDGVVKSQIRLLRQKLSATGREYIKNALLARDKELDMLFERLYEDNVAGKIDDARFAKMAKRYEQEQGEAAGKIKALRLELKKAEGQQMDMEDFLATVRRYTHVTKITRRMVSELIDHIDVYHAEKQDGVTNQQVVIHYNCIGAFEVPDRKKIPEANIIMETRKGVAVGYAPAQIAV